MQGEKDTLRRFPICLEEEEKEKKKRKNRMNRKGDIGCAGLEKNVSQRGAYRETWKKRDRLDGGALAHLTGFYVS